MKNNYKDLGEYSDILEFITQQQQLFPRAEPGEQTRNKIKEILGMQGHSEQPAEVKVEQSWQEDGLVCEELSWSAGFGPRTSAWFFKPDNGKSGLPGVAALHCHSGFRYYGKEKIADGPKQLPCSLDKFRKNYYGGRPFVNYLARRGFGVLVHDVFSWGSRKFPLETMPKAAATARDLMNTQGKWFDGYGLNEEIIFYNIAANQHEGVLERYCNLLGSTFAGVISFEDRVAVNYLKSRDDIDADRIGCIGLSGGGCRSALLQATCDSIKAAVIVGMMSTYEPMFDHNISGHTFMLFPAGWSRYGDWPDLAAVRAPSPLLVQYDLDDSLFPESGMRQADLKLRQHYKQCGYPEAYTGEFYEGPHKFDIEMQEKAFFWLQKNLVKT